ncbi:MAG TPA: hypothetical protein VFK38_11280, partial [Candidatus Limnocylindrales bacterium]|nr:hypothetical protein [Candidatus Limnocylindrales bacterium]
ITVSAAYQGPVASPAPGQASPMPPVVPPAKEIAVGEDGRFSDSYQLAPGRWQLTITATGAQQKQTTETRTISVAFTGVNLVLEIRHSRAWVKVWVDGVVAPGYEAGVTLQPGKSVEFTAQRSVEVRTGSSGATFFTLNGAPLGSLGKAGVPETWLFQPPAPPQKTNRS